MARRRVSRGHIGTGSAVIFGILMATSASAGTTARDTTCHDQNGKVLRNCCPNVESQSLLRRLFGGTCIARGNSAGRGDTRPAPKPRSPSFSTSDIRLKRDIAPVGTSANGLTLYRFRYLWSESVFVGVMAQDVLEVMPEAVITEANGYMQVDYDVLQLSLLRWEDWMLFGQSGIYPEWIAAAVPIRI